MILKIKGSMKLRWWEIKNDAKFLCIRSCEYADGYSICIC